jgi:CheY-like chemotaxis protein
VLRLEGDIEAHLPKTTLPDTTKAAAQSVTGIGDLYLGDRVCAVVKKIDWDVRQIEVDVSEFLKQRHVEAKQIAEEVRQRQRKERVFNSPFSPVVRAGVAGPTDTATQKLSVLLVEDVEAICSSLTWALQRRGHRVIACDSGRGVRDFLRDGSPIDVALVDLQLYGDSGEAICRELRQHFPAARLYAFTGNSDALTEDAAADGFMDGLILKPVDLGTLAAYVEGRSRPPATERMWALDQVLQSFVGQERLGDGKGGQAPIVLIGASPLFPLTGTQQEPSRSWPDQLARLAGGAVATGGGSTCAFGKAGRCVGR